MPEARFAWNGNGLEHTLQAIMRRARSKSHVVTLVPTLVLRARTSERWHFV